jgi:hypothetical protein
VAAFISRSENGHKLTVLLLDSPDLDPINPEIKECISVSTYFTNLRMTPPAGVQFSTTLGFGKLERSGTYLCLQKSICSRQNISNFVISDSVSCCGAATGRMTAIWVTRHNLQLIGGIAPLILNIGTG